LVDHGHPLCAKTWGSPHAFLLGLAALRFLSDPKASRMRGWPDLGPPPRGTEVARPDRDRDGPGNRLDADAGVAIGQGNFHFAERTRGIMDDRADDARWSGVYRQRIGGQPNGRRQFDRSFAVRS
jgi:hypothetical protein